MYCSHNKLNLEVTECQTNESITICVSYHIINGISSIGTI